MRRWFALVAMCGLLGCSGDPFAQPVQPGYMLVNVDAQCVRSVVLTTLVDQGYMVRSSTDSQIVAGRPALGGGAATFLGTQGEERRVTVLFIPQADNGMRVVINEAFVSNAGSGFERTTPIYPGQGAFSTSGGGTQAMCARR